ncbi:Major facilitator superfamily domain, general substrate transporter [Penicillium occitanis (nom. inval.)]|nr:Major facilitator superfamily domain, general substrate transporter [Penicillium occitanis (nom. inval.)]PCH06367.1 hypothetical protein PENOC_024040 [Penicillium occitanis (nom. inval.)]
MPSILDEMLQLEREGVYLGNWSIKHVLSPMKTVGGRHDRGEDHVQNANLDEVDWDPAEERRLVRKLDMRVLLPCCIIYFLAYLDRANLGNVKILQHGTPMSLENSLTCDRPQGPRLQLGGICWVFFYDGDVNAVKYYAEEVFRKEVLSRGIIVISMASVKSSSGLLIARFCLGIPESGVVCCCVMYFSFWYKPSERALRLGIFHSANSLATAVSGVIAAGVEKSLSGRRGLTAWQWVFIIEATIGVLPIVMAAPIFFMLLTFPEDSTSLNERERYIAVNRFGRGATRKTDLTWDWSTVHRIMTRPSTYVFFISYVSLCTVCVAQGTFMPTILLTPVVLSYRTSTLYGAAEQAVGGAAAVASLSIASIIGPQYLAGFIATCALLGVCILTYLTLPYWLYYEARTRKRKTGHALPLTAIEDAEISHISADALTRIHEVNEHEEQVSEKNAAEKGNEEGQRTVNHVESV